MNIIISGKQMELTDGIKGTIEEKLGRLDFYLHPETELKVTVSAKKARQKVEATIIPISGPIIRAEDIEENLYAAIDVVYDKLNKQLRRYKNRLKHKHQRNTGNNIRIGHRNIGYGIHSRTVPFRTKFINSNRRTGSHDCRNRSC